MIYRAVIYGVCDFYQHLSAELGGGFTLML